MWSTNTLARFLEPRFLGSLADPDGEAQEGDPSGALYLRFQVRMQAGRVQDVRFATFRCVAAIACASVVAEWSLGQTLEQVRQLSVEAVLREVEPLPPTRRWWAPMALATLILALESATG